MSEADSTLRTLNTSPNRAGLVFAALIGGWHALWVLLILIGSAQPLIDFIFWAHMIRPVYFITGFAVLPALVLIVLTTAMGYVFGYIGATIWNKLHKSSNP